MYRSGRLGARALGTFLVARVNAVDAGCTCTVFRSSRSLSCGAGCVLGGLDVVVRFVFVIRGARVRPCVPCVLSLFFPAPRFADASRGTCGGCDFLNFS